jgi:hypothetical protein
MPTPKKRLSSSEEAEYFRCLREMRDEGVSVSEDFSESGPDFHISVIGGLETLIFNLPGGLAGYAIWLRIVARKSGLIWLECEILTEFDDQIVLECFEPGGPYCQVGQSCYLKEEVLNDRFPLRFHRRGDMIVGVIMATGLKPIPAKYFQGMMVPFILSLWDPFGNKTSISSTLSADRSTTPRPKLGRPVSGTFGSLEIPETRIPFGKGR